MKIFIISLLLTLLILGVTFGVTYVPIGLYPIGIFLIVLCIVCYVYKLLFNEKKHLEDICQCLNNSINSLKIEILQNQSVSNDQILSNIADKCLSMNQTITQNTDLLKEELSQKTNTILDNIIENLKNEEERTRKHIEETSNNVSSLLNSQSRIIGESIETSSNLFTKISQENKEILITSISELSSQESSFRETFSLSLSDILQKINVLQEILRTSQKSLINDINNRGNEVTVHIAKRIVDAVDKIKECVAETVKLNNDDAEHLFET